MVHGKYTITTKAIVFKEDKVLLMKRTDYEAFNANQWDLPGGRLDVGEDPNKAIIRETLEETGLNIEIGHSFDAFYFLFPESKTNPDETHSIVITYIAKYVSGELQTSEEHSHIDWYDPNNLPEEVDDWVKRQVLKAIPFKQHLK